MKLTKKYQNLFQILFVIFIFTFSACSADNQNTQAEPTEIPNLAEIEETGVSASGEVVPLVKAELSFQNNAKNLQIQVKPGDEVIEGDVLVESDNFQQIADLESAEARLADAESDYDILKRNFASKIEQDAALANIEAAASAVELAMENLRNTELIAPFSGTIIEVYVDSFEDVIAGEPVILLADMQTQVVETTDLNEIDVKKVGIGNSAEITYDAFPDMRITGKVSDIRLKSSEGSGVNYTVTITPDEKPDNLRWGMSAFIVIDIESE